MIVNWRQNGRLRRPSPRVGRFELLWALLPGHWKRGLATEMARAAIDEGFARGLDRIHASTDEPNDASLRVMERIGMRFDRRGPGDVWEQLHYVLHKPAGTGTPSRSGAR